MLVLAAIALLQTVNKAAIAEHLLAQHAELNGPGLARLAALGDEAFPPILRAYLREGNRVARQVPRPDLGPYFALRKALEQVSSLKRGKDLLAALEHASSGNYVRNDLMSLVRQFSAPKEVVPYFLACLRPPHPDSIVPVYYLADSTDPRAIKFMLERLGDAWADRETRELAYLNLARTDGAEGARVVFRARLKPKGPLRLSKTDAEQVVAAAFEARFHFVENNTAATFVMPAEVPPFALAGWNGPLTWKASPDPKCAEICLVPRTPSASNWEEKFISWDPGHVAAKVSIETIAGPRLAVFEYTLKKFAFGWVVIRAFQTATS